MNKLLIIFFAIIFNSSSFAVESYPDVRTYIDTLVNEVSTMLSDTTVSEETKVEKSKKLISENLDFEKMGGFTLGTHKRALKPDQFKTFINVYTNYVAKSFSDLVKNYKGEKGKINAVQKIPQVEEYIVKTEIVRPGGQPSVKVEYLVSTKTVGKSKTFKVIDVVTEGISMIKSQKQEFNSIFSNQGFDGLINELKHKS